MIWQSPGLPGWRKVNFITVTHRPHHPNIAAGLYCLATSPGFLPTLCEKWSGFFYMHRVFLSYTRDQRLKVSSKRLGNEDKAPCPRALLPGRGSNRGPPVWKSEALTARPQSSCIHEPLRWREGMAGGGSPTHLFCFACQLRGQSCTLNQVWRRKKCVRQPPSPSPLSDFSGRFQATRHFATPNQTPLYYSYLY